MQAERRQKGESELLAKTPTFAPRETKAQSDLRTPNLSAGKR